MGSILGIAAGPARCSSCAGQRRPAAQGALIAPLIIGWAFGVGLCLRGAARRRSGAPVDLPVRFFSWMALAGSAIAAFEVDRISADLRARREIARPAILAALALGIAAVVASYLTRPGHEASGGLGAQREWLGLTLVALTGFAIAVLAGRRGAVALAATLTAVNGTNSTCRRSASTGSATRTICFRRHP